MSIIKISSIQIQLSKDTYMTLIKYFWKSYLTLEQHLTVIWLRNREWERNMKKSKQNLNDVIYTVWKLAWWGGWMRLCQEIKCFWRTCLNITVTRWNFGARNKILSFSFLLFLWDNALQKFRILLYFVKCKPLILTLLSVQLKIPSLLTNWGWN